MNLSKEDSLQKIQEYVWQMNIERGFTTNEDASKKLVVLMEEVGELARAIRKTVGLKFSDTTHVADIADELADVQIVLLGLASIVHVDMFDAVAKKEEKNRMRTWK
jgi:NTP pyrophosphatase (non-canonical NTP hydrolase)